MIRSLIHTRFKLLMLLMCSILVVIPLVSVVTAWAAESSCPGDVVPGIGAHSYILMDSQTGRVLAQRKAWTKRAPASTTKIITGIIALETGNTDSPVQVSPKAAATGEASLELKEGEVLTLEALLYGALLCSGNDACVAISEHIAGSEERFSYLMNQKAFLIGAVDSNFINPHGLPAKGHYSTAYDLALLARYSLRNTHFGKIVSSKTKVINTITPNKKRYLYNTNQLLWGTVGANGVKTGTTVEAGRCLVASVTRDGRQLITVVLKSPDRYRDTLKLLEYGFRKSKNTLDQEG